MTSKPKKRKTELIATFPEPVEKEKAEAMAKMALSPSANAAAVADEYLKGPFGAQDIGSLFDALSASVKDVWEGDTKRIEAMLFAQATALQTIFTSLARRANSQQYLRNLETFLRLALKAQTQCRATLETLAAIKNPPTVFARQANIAHGPQQVNNGVLRPERAGAHAGESETAKTELLGASDGERLDTGTTSATIRRDPALATMG